MLRNNTSQYQQLGKEEPNRHKPHFSNRGAKQNVWYQVVVQKAASGVVNGPMYLSLRVSE